RLYIKSNDEPVARALRQIVPTPTVSLSDDERTDLVVPVALGVPTPFDDFAPTWIDLPAFALLDGLTAAWSRPRGHLLTVSTIDPPDEIDALLSAGNADGIVTNRPDLAHFSSGRPPSPTPGDGPFPCGELEAAIASRALARDVAFDAGLDLFRLQRRYDDNCVTLAQIQVVGTHNSYHQRPHPDLLVALGTESPLDAFSWDYAHAPIPVQLEQLGVRQLELDVFADPEGGLFADPFGRRLVGEPPPADPALLAPGFKVLHQQDVDFETSCSTLVACLGQVRDFSDANPRHLPIFVQLELKDGPPNAFEDEAVETVPFDDPALLDALEAEILSVFARERLITPDDVRGDAATLEEAVLAGGWPTLGRSRGRIVLLLDNEGPRRDLYVAGHPSLAGRLLFAPSPVGTPEAAFLKRNDPFADAADIRARVAEGYLVRTRADSSTVEARFGQRRRRNLAFASGAQIVSTDYPEPDPVRTDYRVRIPGPAVARCNPLTAPPACRQAGLAVDPGIPTF
nr:Ca2+-dependent phosphoinositide-specific phospholipase C [Myxococcota bacterium]